MTLHLSGRLAILFLLPFVLLATTACNDEGRPPASPADAALELFRVARQTEPDAGRVERLFGPPADDLRRAALHDALEQLGVAAEPRVLAVLALEDEQRRVVVDLAARLPGEGSASFSVVVERVGEDWRVTWFQGPGIGWPPERRRKDPGLSTSPPPGPSQVR